MPIPQVRTMYSMTGWHRKVVGSTTMITVMSGNRMRRNRGLTGARPRTGLGVGRIAVGTGTPTRILGGQHITMGVGSGLPGSAGCGYQVIDGRQRGSPGAKRMMTITSVGHPSRQKHLSMPSRVFVWQPANSLFNKRVELGWQEIGLGSGKNPFGRQVPLSELR